MKPQIAAKPEKNKIKIQYVDSKTEMRKSFIIHLISSKLYFETWENV